MKAIQEKTERTKAMHVLTAPQGRASDDLHGDRKGMTYEETVGATEDRFGDQHQAVGYRDHLKTRAQGDSGPLQEFSTATEQLTHRAFPALHEDHVRRGLSNAFGNKIRYRSMKQQLLLGGNKKINQALRQTAGLEVVRLTIGSSIRLRKTSDRALRMSRPLPKRKKRLPATYAGAVGAPATSEILSPRTGRRNGYTPIGYSR
jgi:hypothetical protein